MVARIGLARGNVAIYAADGRGVACGMAAEGEVGGDGVARCTAGAVAEGGVDRDGVSRCAAGRGRHRNLSTENIHISGH